MSKGLYSGILDAEVFKVLVGTRFRNAHRIINPSQARIKFRFHLCHGLYGPVTPTKWFVPTGPDQRIAILKLNDQIQTFVRNLAKIGLKLGHSLIFIRWSKVVPTNKN